jgi:hypothetical protein
VSSRPDAHLFIVPSRPDDVSYRPDVLQTKASFVRMIYMVLRPDTPLYREASVPSCIHPNVSAAPPDDSQCSIKLQIFFPKANMGRLS